MLVLAMGKVQKLYLAVILSLVRQDMQEKEMFSELENVVQVVHIMEML